MLPLFRSVPILYAYPTHPLTCSAEVFFSSEDQEKEEFLGEGDALDVLDEEKEEISLADLLFLD